MNKKIWKSTFNQQAKREGWNLFDLSGGMNDGKFRIQCIDDIDSLKHQLQAEHQDGYNVPELPFNSDEEAIRFVRKLAQEGKPHAIRALQLHNKYLKEIIK